MTKEEFYKQNDEKYLSLGFEKDLGDPMFGYSKSLISEDIIEENDLDVEDIPKLLIGDTGLNKGFCIYTGTHFIWLSCQTPEEAIAFSNQIVAFEEC